MPRSPGSLAFATTFTLTLTLASTACDSASTPASPTTTPGATSAPESDVFEGMGTHTRPVVTSSPQAQRYFDQGMAFLHGFNHDEASRSFQRAAELDPECAMAHWAVALANGPHINNSTVPPEREHAAVEAIARARVASGASELDRQLIEALAKRHVDPVPEDRKALDAAYAEAMRALWQQHPDDADVGAWFAEAAMDLRPWDLWKADGSPHEGTEEIVATLETVMKMQPDHPLALHLYIHAIEASPDPQRAEAAADALRDLVPGHGHLQHMPSHIDVRTGRWADAVQANIAAHKADTAYRARVPQQDFYRLYMAHNLHMLAYGAMMVGRSAEAIEAADKIVADIPLDWARENPDIADGYMTMPLEVRMRFGKWDEILAAPELPDYLPLSVAMRHYARGVAYAAQKQPQKARAELDKFEAARDALPEGASFGINSGADILKLAGTFLEGEVLYREGKVDEGIARLREAAELEDKLAYNEPPDWILPARHALGAALLGQKRAKEAEAVYREDLERLPHNGWALWGLARSLRLQSKDDDAAKVDAEFEQVWKDADLTLHSSCMCLPGV